MGSSSFGRPNTRRGKKNGSEKQKQKQKQPQRGLGVAQLEKIRLHGQNNFNPSLYPQEDATMKGGYSSSSIPYAFYPNTMMGVHEDQYERTAMSWNPNYGILESQHSLEPNTTRHFSNEDPSSTRGSSENQEIDLELRLAL